MTAADPRDGLHKVQATAPKRIWLAVSDEPSDRDEPFPPPHEGLCWSSDEPVATCVPYVRADLAHGCPEAVDSNKPVAWWNGISESVFNERDGRGPSIRWGSDAENAWHDIPLYAGYNPVRAQQVALLEEAALTPERAP